MPIITSFNPHSSIITGIFLSSLSLSSSSLIDKKTEAQATNCWWKFSRQVFWLQKPIILTAIQNSHQPTPVWHVLRQGTQSSSWTYQEPKKKIDPTCPWKLPLEQWEWVFLFYETINCERSSNKLCWQGSGNERVKCRGEWPSAGRNPQTKRRPEHTAITAARSLPRCPLKRTHRNQLGEVKSDTACVLIPFRPADSSLLDSPLTSCRLYSFL